MILTRCQVLRLWEAMVSRDGAGVKTALKVRDHDGLPKVGLGHKKSASTGAARKKFSAEASWPEKSPEPQKRSREARTSSAFSRNRKARTFRLLRGVEKPGILRLLWGVEKPGILRLLREVQKEGILPLLRGRPSRNRSSTRSTKGLAFFGVFWFWRHRDIFHNMSCSFTSFHLLSLQFSCLALIQTNAAMAVFQFYMSLSEFRAFCQHHLASDQRISSFQLF